MDKKLTLEDVEMMDDVTIFEDIEDYADFGRQVEGCWGISIFDPDERKCTDWNDDDVENPTDTNDWMDFFNFEAFGEDIAMNFHWIDKSTAWIEDELLSNEAHTDIFSNYPAFRYDMNNLLVVVFSGCDGGADKNIQFPFLNKHLDVIKDIVKDGKVKDVYIGSLQCSCFGGGTCGGYVDTRCYGLLEKIHDIISDMSVDEINKFAWQIGKEYTGIGNEMCKLDLYDIKNKVTA